MASVEHAQAHARTVYDGLEAKRGAEQKRIEHARERQSLEMQRENILSQRTSNAGRREALEAALKQIEAQIAELG